MNSERNNKPHTLIVGGTRGIGRALSDLLSRREHEVSVIGRKYSESGKIAHKSVRYWLTDISIEENLIATLTEIENTRGPIGHIVFFQRYRGDDNSWEKDIDVTLTVSKNVIEFLAPKMKSLVNPSIVMMGSVIGQYITVEQPLPYHVTKGAVHQFIRYYAVNLGKMGIRINGVSPSIVLKEETKHFILENKKLCKVYEELSPLARFGTAEEVSKVIAFLLSTEASFITGQMITVDGGISLLSQDFLCHRLSEES